MNKIEKPTKFHLQRLYWGSVAGNEAEPVRIEWKDGMLLGYTLGCQDPFVLASPDCPLKILGNNAKRRADQHGFLDNAHDILRPTVPQSFGGPPEDAQESVPSLKSHGWRGPSDKEGT
jgi:hypothetical protein